MNMSDDMSQKGVFMINKKQFDVFFVKFIRLLGNKFLLAFLAVAAVLPFVISLVFPLERVFVEYSDTRSASFFLIMGVILLGMFNSFMIIYNERKVIRFEYMMRGLSLPTYILARAISQFVLCSLETLLMVIVINYRYKSLQGHLEQLILIYITLLLTMFAADMAGMFISTLYKNYIVGVVSVVLVIVVQLAFGGFLADLTTRGALIQGVSYGMISKWGTVAFFCIANSFLGTQSGKNALMQVGDKNAYIYSLPKILACWLLLIVFAALFAMLATVALRLVKKDKR